VIQHDKFSASASIVAWFLWCAFAGSLIAYRMWLVGAADNTNSIRAPQDVGSWLAYIIPTGLALTLRWLVIPKLRNPFLKLIPFLVGLSAAELLTFLGIFIFQLQFSLYFLTNGLLLLQMLPLWGFKQSEAPVAQ
jgi:hypothetical protein